ncbi:transcription elongation factor GreB [Chitiniphilus purpureus]|uniref:Transcription elongation factor GreB n=1 Tax=Chitiniphilus purpureus TaxID=2981137 RepID=A0ABY6DL24_9NEIS|nr:transcription elongation factor GreB [Chitiniphilus sp. CD1]UXY14171.1 transcription elongation factor GreB [Chitiniphilus sp. CD1]
MSKAFTREDDRDADEDSLPSELRLPQGSKNYMTPLGWDRLRVELYDLVHKERPHVTQVVNWAASNGDRSENADYQYGKRRLREIDRRIRFLQKRLENAEVVDPEAREPTDQVFFGATVTYLREDGREERVAIVGIDETDLKRHRISWTSPVARALLKAREGDTVQLRTPAGIETLEILEVQYRALD